jgi:cystathionine beta-lyase
MPVCQQGSGSAVTGAPGVITARHADLLKALKPMHDATLVTTAGRDPERHGGIVNPPVYRASTILAPTVAEFESRKPFVGLSYGRAGTPTTFAFEEAIAELEGGHRAIALASGLAAMNLPLAALLRAGDHVLVVDSCYGPTRRFCTGMLARFGVRTTFYDPRVGADIGALIEPATRLVFLESPGSLTFEVQDVPAIVAAARAHGVLTMIDATWATPLLLKPLRLGVDIVAHAVTKYIGGHSDLMMGVVTTTEAVHDRVRSGIYEFGAPASPEDCWLALRGLRTLDARLERHARSALRIATWLEDRPEVARVLYPALPSDPGHALWLRDFRGASGLFGVVLRPYPMAAVHAMVDGLRLFRIGASWGGFESLCLVTHPERFRTAVPWTEPGPVLRLHVGLEDPDDLIADLEAGLARLTTTAERR